MLCSYYKQWISNQTQMNDLTKYGEIEAWANVYYRYHLTNVLVSGIALQVPRYNEIGLKPRYWSGLWKWQLVWWLLARSLWHFDSIPLVTRWNRFFPGVSGYYRDLPLTVKVGRWRRWLELFKWGLTRPIKIGFSSLMPVLL